MSCTLKSIFAAAALSGLTLSVWAPAASAEKIRPGVELVAVKVSHADLDISTRAGGQALLNRIEGAARKVCRVATPTSKLKLRSMTDCRRETIATTVKNLGMPSVTLAWSDKYAPNQIASR